MARAFGTITKGQLEALAVILPDSACPDAFERCVQHLGMTASRHNESENRTLAQLRDLLLPKLMSGEIRLHEAEKLVGEGV